MKKCLLLIQIYLLSSDLIGKSQQLLILELSLRQLILGSVSNIKIIIIILEKILKNLWFHYPLSELSQIYSLDKNVIIEMLQNNIMICNRFIPCLSLTEKSLPTSLLIRIIRKRIFLSKSVLPLHEPYLLSL